jgi:RimJ/RimL family protein N-acetyltransferase
MLYRYNQRKGEKRLGMQEVQKFLAKNHEEVTLRPAVPGDAAAIIRTIKSASTERSYVLMEQYGKNAESEEEYIRLIDCERCLLLVATIRGEVVGSLAAFQADGGENPRTAHVLQIGLHLAEAYRGLGVGSGMLHYVDAWAREHRFRKLEASIFTTNKRSLHLFTRSGFQEEGTRLKRLWVGNQYFDEVLMGKVLE